MENNMKVILTYGTFDLFHIGHLKLLERLKLMGDFLIVGVSTDEFNQEKGKSTVIPYNERAEIVKSLKVVDSVIPEFNWNQKIEDIKKHNVDLFAMGDDWNGKFDYLNEFCEVIYLPRTEGISSTDLKKKLKVFDKSHIQELKQAIDTISAIVEKFN